MTGADTMELSPRLGLRENFPQFTLLVLMNAFVGAMVGMERSVLPLLAEREFGIASHSALLSFLVSFGIVKGLSNLAAGRLADRAGRRSLLLLGWLFGIPVPFLLIWAPGWSWVIAANILLGVNQGLCWSATVIMKIDLVGPRQRGAATGWNEFSGYIAVAVAAYCTAALAARYGLRPVPFYLGIGCSLLGLLLTLLFVRETRQFIAIERGTAGAGPAPPAPFGKIFYLASWHNRKLFGCSQAGLVNNLNDGMAWGLLPLFYASLGFSLGRIGFLAALYPAVWGICQLFTGPVSDRLGRKWMIVLGLWLQATAIFLIAGVTVFGWQAASAVLLGLGTAMVYPTLLAAVGDAAQPAWRASALGVYRLWRDLGYAAGALLSGAIADRFGAQYAIFVIGAITLLSGAVVARTYSAAPVSGEGGNALRWE